VTQQMAPAAAQRSAARGSALLARVGNWRSRPAARASRRARR